MTSAVPTQLPLFAATAPSVQLTLAVDPPPAAPPTRANHRYEKNRDGKVICRRCTVERRESDTGRRHGFVKEWRVFSQEAGNWIWTPVPPPCVPPPPKPTPKRRRERLTP
jgi:hypothetical protein